MECLIVIALFMLYAPLISCNKFNIIRFKERLVQSHLICITDQTNNAMIWNANDDVETPDTMWVPEFMHNENIIKDRRICDIDDRSHDCKFSFVDTKSDWEITWNTDVPMGPVFDTRWEKFETRMKSKSGPPNYQPVTVNKNGVESNLIFDRSGTLVVSIRGNTDANFLMCTDSDYSKSFCYWIIVGGWANNTAIRKCQRGVSVYPEYQDCAELQVKEKHNALSIHEWNTYVITWDAFTKTIKLYDPDDEILSYTDDSKHDNSTLFNVLFGSPEDGFRTRYRFHQYNYNLTTRPGAQYDSYNYKIESTSTREICIDMMIGLCASCELSVRLVDPADNRELAKKRISGLSPVRNGQHGLPMWQYVRIIAPNNNKRREFVMIKITTELIDEQGRKHWAIRNVQQCLPEGTVKRMYMLSRQVNDGRLIWPNATCQRLAYDQEHGLIIRSNMKLMSPPDNVTVCPESRVGPRCSTICEHSQGLSCQGVSICDENLCYCSSGHTVADGCYGKCREGSGEFGYNCREKCNNCLAKRCNIYTGRCILGCNKLEGEYQFVPPFCTDTVRFPELRFSQLDSKTVRVYFLKDDHDRKFKILYEFELEVNDSTLRKQIPGIGKDDAKNRIYSTIFNDLSPGTRLRARIIQHIRFNSIDEIENLQLEGDFSKQWTTCMWTSNFSIEFENRVLIIDKKNSEQQSFRCHDEYFTIKVIPTEWATYESRKTNTINVTGILPMTIGNLSSGITKYEILITSINSSDSHHQEVRTVPSTVTSLRMELSSVREFKIDNVTSTEVSVSWLPQEDTNDTIYGYSLTIKALYHKGCVNDASVELMSAQSHNITNISRSYTIHDLIPYVHYKLTILAHHAQKDDASSISFATNATEIPTAVFQNLSFRNGKIKWTTRVSDCSAVTGPLHATRLFFFGESENVKDFVDEYNSMSDTFKLNETKKQDIYGCEKYRVRIHALRDIDGKHNESVYNEITFITDPRAPNSPGAVDITDIGKGVVSVDWKHPSKTGGPIKEFIIKCRIISTNLTRNIWNFERNIISIYPTNDYQELHTTRLNLLPSTYYEMKISGIVQCARRILIGEPSRIVFETQSSFAWYKDEPSYTVDMTNKSITLTVPKIANVTVDCEIHVVVIGNDLCKEIPTMSESLTRVIGLKNNEKAWHINSSLPSSSSSISIGSYVDEGNITNCSLVAGSTYEIAIVLSDDDIEVSNQTDFFVWRSKSIYIGSSIRHEFWAIPLLLLFIIGSILTIRYLKKSSRRQRNKVIKNRTVHRPPEKLKMRSITPIYQEPAVLNAAVSNHDHYLTPVNTHLYEEIDCKTLVEVDKFLDYVESSIASGELQNQYSWISPGQVQSWEDGLLSDHANGDEYDNAFAIDEMVVVLEDPDDPYFECTNAHYINGYKKDKAYIVLQGPQPNTDNTNFWRVIWQERVEVICTISDIREDEQVKSNDHWPELDKSVNFGDISVENISHSLFADYTFRLFVVKRNEEIRVINHLHYTAWPDYKIPLYTQSIVTYLKKLFAISSTSGPVLVHCSVDFGRTGTIILLDICHRCAVTEGVINVFDETERIRKQRANMVNTKQQYIFAHVVLVDCLLTPSTAILCDDSIHEKIDEHRNRFEELQKHTDQCVMLNQMIQSLMQPQLKLSEKNINKNRFTESLPMTRLYLPRYPISHDESSYISGVYVDSAQRRNSYIASQLPLPTTMTDFWRMIAAFKIELIIILQRPDIQDSTCCRFVPEPDEEIETHSFFSIKGKSISNGEYFFRQKIILIDKSMESSSEQLVTILTCKGWDLDRGKRLPTPAALIDLYRTAERIANHDKSTVVLCYDGVTGCGLYLALSILLEKISVEHDCDVCFAIRAVRRSRSDFCQTQDQFEYLYNAASFYISGTKEMS